MNFKKHPLPIAKIRKIFIPDHIISAHIFLTEALFSKNVHVHHALHPGYM